MLPELWINIIGRLDCKTILNINLTSKYFNNLIKNNHLYMKRKFRGFPRAENRAKDHNINHLFCNRNGNISQEKENEINIFLEKGVDHNFIRGDVISFGNYQNQYSQTGGCIFDGQKLMDFNFTYPMLCCPSKFRIINNNVPTNYWIFTNSSLIWFDSTEVHEQRIKNIAVSVDNMIYTTFNYNSKEYCIRYCENYEKIKRTVDESRDGLLKLFQKHKLFACVNNSYKDDSNIDINEDHYSYDSELGCSLYEYFLK